MSTQNGQSVVMRKVRDLRTGDVFLETNNQIYTVIQYYLFEGKEVWAESHPELHVREYTGRDLDREVLVTKCSDGF